MKNQPIASYGVLLCGFSALFYGLNQFAKKCEQEVPQKPISNRDIALLAIATHKITKILAKDRITEVVRSPFVKELPGEDKEVGKGHGLQQAIGNLITCQFCLGPWVATSLLFGFKLAPHFTRRLALVFVTVTGSDFLHLSYQALKNRTPDLHRASLQQPI